MFPIHQPNRNSLLSAALLKRKKMMGENNTTNRNEQLPLYDEHLDPLLRMQFDDPLAAIRTTRKGTIAETEAMPPPPNKKPRLSRASSSSSSSSAPPPKKTKMRSPLLHQTCRLFPRCAPVVESALEMEPEAATKRAESLRNKGGYVVGDARVPYSLPINILLHQNASLQVLRIVSQAAPQALVLKDGRDECSSLGIALRLHGHATRKGEEDDETSNNNTPETIPEVILNANPTAAQLPDRRNNFALHAAAYAGASFDVIHKLFFAYPEALLESNFCGETPLDICIRNGKCSDRSTSFLQEKTHHLKSARLRYHANQMHAI